MRIKHPVRTLLIVASVFLVVGFFWFWRVIDNRWVELDR